ncbi:hypothetical protein ZIOFF_045465 [Zingiber officinale]|uniref:Uncharacterized protein n=1 Tax=Zingiber officinale TaxID=94328 RepID=A0A8J5G3V6_ZINOF|nr:hypothetical protein ZIOFF_045465 [Zingiber officinale]
MPARFWGEAVRHAAYLLNRLPTKALGDRTPFEAWMGRKPHLAHLRVFGCVAYVKNTTPHLKKLDDRSSPMVYLGVEEGCKAHRLFDPRHDKLQVSRDVVFQENSEWTWTAGANHEENLPEFMVEDALDTDEVIVVADIEAGTEDVAPPATAVVPMTRASSPSTSSSSTHTTTSPDSHEGPVRFRSIADIYANTEEVVGIDEEENEVMLMMSEEPTCYQEAATEACCLVELGFKKCTQEHAVYIRGEGESSILVGVYVDDLIVTGGSTEKINKFKQQMMTEFDMSDLSLLSYYLGIEVEQQKSRISLRQSAYAKKILSQFKMADCNATKHPMEPKTQLHKDLEGTPVDATEYRRIVGCLRYLLHTRPDLPYSVGMASRYMERPTIMHHRKQKTVALSSCEAEFMAATTAACHALWLRSLASELTGVKPKPPMTRLYPSPPPPPATSPQTATSLQHIVFGIAASAKLWECRREYIKLWWRPHQMRGFVWLDRRYLPLPLHPPGGDRSTIRISRIVSETYRLGLPGVRWYVMGDDDTVFVHDNLARVLSRFDHRQPYYIGSPSESHLQNIFFSYAMGYCGGGFAISAPLAASLSCMHMGGVDRCLRRYPAL